MSESLASAYNMVHTPDGHESWTARFKLPEPLPRDMVMAEIHRGVQAMRYSPLIPFDEVAEHGLSGALVGAEDDHDANIVHDVIFATDPSRKFGQRDAADSDRHAVRIARLNNWTEVHEDGSPLDDANDEEDLGLEGLVRVIMGRNKDHYGGTDAFTLDEARGMLLPNTQFATSGGYLFSDRPGWENPYGEPAIIVKMDADAYDEMSNHELELYRLALALNRQHRFVLETPWGVEAYQINEEQPTT